MEIEFGQIELPVSDTQLEIIRELMLAASNRGAWMTLAEIAVQTEFGEASISAQLRHLRKVRHGRYRVEKRRRRVEASKMSGEECASFASGLWEYQVVSPGLGDGFQSLRGGCETGSAQSL
jgi:hypothetical protein